MSTWSMFAFHCFRLKFQGDHDDYGFAAMYGVGAQTSSEPPPPAGTGPPASDLMELSRARSIPEITGIAGGIFHSGAQGGHGVSAAHGGGHAMLNQSFTGCVDDPILTGMSSGRPRSMHEHFFNSAGAQNTAHSLPERYPWPKDDNR
ncbi:hypothetical protein BIW11_02867 [Tropilaelaps mercedesae]|uniref:Uncharacterized protein n=1 Tax=Tropilaelaps mercedesae TaxID=418985 RepID=A0A1V9XW85_9ACAR|nr:hypothetical protein BIW11_02867 [Tropilaelaps mercedesae]